MRHKLEFCEKLEIFMQIITSETIKLGREPFHEPRATKLLGQILRDFVETTEGKEKPHIVKNQVCLANKNRIDLQIDNNNGVEFWQEEALSSFKRDHFKRQYSNYFPVLYIEYSKKTGSFTNIFEQKQQPRELIVLRGSLQNIFPEKRKEAYSYSSKRVSEILIALKENSKEFLKEPTVQYLIQNWDILWKKIGQFHLNSNIAFSEDLALKLKSRQIYRFTDKNKPNYKINMKEEMAQFLKDPLKEQGKDKDEIQQREQLLKGPGKKKGEREEMVIFKQATV